MGGWMTRIQSYHIETASSTQTAKKCDSRTSQEAQANKLGLKGAKGGVIGSKAFKGRLSWVLGQFPW